MHSKRLFNSLERSAQWREKKSLSTMIWKTTGLGLIQPPRPETGRLQLNLTITISVGL
jgi:hypothetical protein